MVNIKVSNGTNGGFGTCRYCGKLVQISRNQTHQCPLSEEEYYPRFLELINLCKELDKDQNFREWLRNHALTHTLLLCVMSDIHETATIDSKKKDCRFVKIVKNKDCCNNIEVD